MKNNISNFLKKWWKCVIVDLCPKELEDIEFSEKFREWKTYQEK